MLHPWMLQIHILFLWARLSSGYADRVASSGCAGSSCGRKNCFLQVMCFFSSELLPLLFWQFWTRICRSEDINAFQCWNLKSCPVPLTEEFLIGVGQRTGAAELDFWVEFCWKKNILRQNGESWGHVGTSAWSPCPHPSAPTSTHLSDNRSCLPLKGCCPSPPTIPFVFTWFLLSSHVAFKWPFSKPEPITAHQEKAICFHSQMLEGRAFSQDFWVHTCSGVLGPGTEEDVFYILELGIL